MQTMELQAISSLHDDLTISLFFNESVKRRNRRLGGHNINTYINTSPHKRKQCSDISVQTTW